MEYVTRHMTEEEKEEAILIIEEERGKGTSWAKLRRILDRHFGRHNETPRTYQRIWNEHLSKVKALELMEESQRERYKNNDVLREYRNDIRTRARLDVVLEAVREGLEDLEPIPLPEYLPKATGTNRMIVNISDMHVGAKHENYVSKYNLDITKERLNEYADEVIRTAKKDKVSEMLIINLGDQIEGFIHISTRVQAELDAVEQTIIAGELIAQFIAKVYMSTGANIKVGAVLDNHSRIHPNKKEHIEKESLGRIVEYIYRLRLEMYPIEFIGNYVDPNIGYTEFGGYRVAWVHGHLDTPARAKKDIERILGTVVDLVYIAHRHHLLIGEDVIQVGSMKGTDEYAFNKRLGSRASQTMTIFEGNTITHKSVYFEKIGERYPQDVIDVDIKSEL